MFSSKTEEFIDRVLTTNGYFTEDDVYAVCDMEGKYGNFKSNVKSYMRVRLAEIKKEKEDLKASETSVQTPKSGKHGVINTCPNCGATVEAGSVKCTECGYIFTGVGANSSAAELDRRLRNVTGTNSDSDKKRANIISSFPIPNAREDLFEFLAALEPKALVNNTSKKQEEQKITKAYLEKFLECLNKARIGFGNDSATMMFIEHYNAFQSKKKKKLYLMIVAAICIVVVAAIGIFKYVQDANELQASYEQWYQESKMEIQAYSDSLYRELDKIPAPNARNWEECGRLWNRVTWSKSWEVPKKFESLDWERLDSETGKAFEERKNSIGETIRKAHKQALRNQGLDEYSADEATRNEFFEIRVWI